ncbi:MAG: hypothetical protein KKC80_04270 [Candidatus Margulisbacteria bacterium]|nr:hypothetical protein [Candidatus Margulisiibacteriota bacterium]MBU1616208.1 hypothetical protein [Candidatus Margulisiibacteriota bacterium]
MGHLYPLSSSPRVVMHSAKYGQRKINLPAVISRQLRDQANCSQWTICLGEKTFFLPKGRTISVGGEESCDIYFPTMADRSIYLEISIDNTGKDLVAMPRILECKTITQGTKTIINLTSWTETTSNHALSLSTISLSLIRKSPLAPPFSRERSNVCFVSPQVEPAKPTEQAEKPANTDELSIFLEQFCQSRAGQIKTKNYLPIIYRGLATGTAISALLYLGSVSTAQTVLAGILGIFFIGSLINYTLSNARFRETDEALLNRLKEVNCESIAESLRLMERDSRKIIMSQLEAAFPEKAYAVKTYLDAISKAILG